MTRILICFLSILPFTGVSQTTDNIDPVAISLIDKMGEVIGGMEAISFHLRSVNDDRNQLGLMERTFTAHEVYFRGPDRMAVYNSGDKGSTGYWYNGEYITWYSFDENNYVTLPAPESIIKTIDSVNSKFGMEFPAADLFYPSFGDDLLEYFGNVTYMGIKNVEGVACHHIIAETKTDNFQIWIENGAFYLPKKFLFIKKGDSPSVVEGTFENWDTNPQLPDEIFEFNPPANADLISIMPKN